MVQRRGRPRLLLEALQARRRPTATSAGSTLIATSRAEPRVPRPVHLSHPARAERREDLVGAEARSRRRESLEALHTRYEIARRAGECSCRRRPSPSGVTSTKLALDAGRIAGPELPKSSLSPGSVQSKDPGGYLARALHVERRQSAVQPAGDVPLGRPAMGSGDDGLPSIERIDQNLWSGRGRQTSFPSGETIGRAARDRPFRAERPGLPPSTSMT